VQGLERICTLSSSYKKISLSHVFEQKYAYTGFARNTSRNHDNIGTFESFCETFVVREVSLDLGIGRDMRQIRRNSGSVDDIVQAELTYEKVSDPIQKPREREQTSVTRGSVFNSSARGCPIPPINQLHKPSRQRIDDG